MSTMQSEVFKALRSIDVPEDKALAAAASLNKRDENVADLQSDMRLLKWMVGAVLVMELGLLGTLFSTLIRLGEISGQVAQLAQRLH